MKLDIAKNRVFAIQADYFFQIPFAPVGKGRRRNGIVEFLRQQTRLERDHERCSIRILENHVMSIGVSDIGLNTKNHVRYVNLDKLGTIFKINLRP